MAKVAFDGTSIWVTNNASNTVSKINPALGTKADYPTGTTPQGIAFGGTSIWVAFGEAFAVSDRRESALRPGVGVTHGAFEDSIGLRPSKGTCGRRRKSSRRFTPCRPGVSSPLGRWHQRISSAHDTGCTNRSRRPTRRTAIATAQATRLAGCGHQSAIGVAFRRVHSR